MHPLDIQNDLVADLLTRFLRDESGRFGFQRAVLGLSGGIDSAVSCALAARAFGADQVLAVRMPYVTSNPNSESDALEVAEALGVRTIRVDITPMVDGYLEQAQVQDRTRRGNVMARARMIVLYDHSAADKALVIGTSNKTEMLLGYSTQFGDAASALNPLGDLYKHQVFSLARYLELPPCVINKAPSADLFEGQSDEEDLGFTYAEADAALFDLVDRRLSADELAQAGHSASLIDSLQRRVRQNQYKRLQPTIAKLGQRTVGLDFRYLRAWGT